MSTSTNHSTNGAAKAATPTIEEQIQRLMSENASWQAEYDSALEANDVDLQLKLEDRRNEMARRLNALQIQQYHARQARLEAKLPALRQEYQAALKLSHEANEKLKAAQQAANEASYKASGAHSALRGVEYDIRASKDEVARLTHTREKLSHGALTMSTTVSTGQPLAVPA